MQEQHQLKLSKLLGTNDLTNPDRTLELYPKYDKSAVNFSTGLEIYEIMERGDAHIRACLDSRKSAILSLDWNLYEPDFENNNTQEIMEFINKQCFEILNMQDILGNLTNALTYGFVVLEKQFQYFENLLFINRLHYRSPKWFDFSVDSDDNVLLSYIDAESNKKTLDVTNFIIHSHNKNDENPYGKSVLGVSVWWLYFFKKKTLSFLLKKLEKHGLPTIIGKYDSLVTKEEKDSLFEMVKNLINDYVAIIPNNADIQFLESSNIKSNFEDKALRYFDEQISKAILGQTMTTDDGGSYSQANVHYKVLSKIIQNDAKQIESTINEQLIKPLIELNFGMQDSYPYFKYEPVILEDLNEKIKVDLELVKNGLSISENYFYAMYNIPKPSENEELLIIPTQNISDNQILFYNNYNKSSNSKLFKTTISEDTGNKVLLQKFNRANKEIEIFSSIITTGFDDFVNSFQSSVNYYRNKILAGRSNDDLLSLFENDIKELSGLTSNEVQDFRLYDILKPFHVKLFNNNMFSHLFGEQVLYDYAITKVKLSEYPQGMLTYFEALDFFSKKRPIQDGDIDRLTDIYNSVFFRVAGQTNITMLERLQKYLVFNIESGLKVGSYKDDINNIFDKAGVTRLSSHHLINVYKTNLFSSYGAGKYKQFQNVKDIFPYCTYVTVDDEAVRPNHRALHGYTADIKTFEDKALFPPLGYQCRCTWVIQTEQSIKQEGFKLDKQGHPPATPDEGWDGNPYIKYMQTES